ncbi:YceH family protein [Diaphorobacter aerolatus]|uniref:YceH family protein n=1 Tax=Diaphorobacter aerolatus TaxID=1288495 RepID=A0A7H0GNC2_9BURK|nr:YceH family protein [Diaphorobacter aerolatus]QNP49788.1 YceH family protein [Diaphorobacter aerolatus]
MPFDPQSAPLSADEARVLATLVEKSRTVPDSYPLTLNSLASGCNQKTSREPVMQLSDGQIQEALDDLRRRSLVTEIGGARTSRWEHNFPRGVGVPDQSAALLCLLMLRGPQTAGELRINSERWHRFADISSVEAFLDELQSRSEEKGGPLVILLPRAHGAREPRWAHLLCGPVDASALAAASASASTTTAAQADPALSERVTALEGEVAALRVALAQVCEQLGIDIESKPAEN